MNIFEKVICFIGGADLNILKNHPIDKIKFTAVGIGVLNTTLLSMCTMGFAIYSIAKKSEISIINGIEKIQNVPFTAVEICLIILFSFFWGLIIFGIDWGLISTIHKKEKYSFRSVIALFFTTLFRLLVALVISFTVSKPLEVYVFKDYLPVAKREMQVDYQNKLNSVYRDKEEHAEQNLKEIELKIENLPKIKQEAYSNDILLQTFIDEKEHLTNIFDNLNTRYNILNNQSSTNINSAKQSINGIQKQIDNIKSNGDLSESLRLKIENLMQSKYPYENIIVVESNNISTRKNELNKAYSDIDNKQKDINDRIAEIDETYASMSPQLDSMRTRYTENKEYLSKIAKSEYTKNDAISNVFSFDNLINNIIAIGYLEKWNNDPEAEIGEKEIAKKVSFVRWLMMVVIIIIDTAPIVIKLLIKRGGYDEERDTIEAETHLKLSVDSLAKQKVYPIYAGKIIQQRAIIDEIKSLAIMMEDFDSIIDGMRSQSMRNIDNTMRNSSECNDEAMKTTLSDYVDKLKEKFNITKNKMFKLCFDFIDNLK